VYITQPVPHPSLQSWRWKHHGTLIHWHPPMRLYGVTTQKTAIWYLLLSWNSQAHYHLKKSPPLDPILR
jgi:hypothetical protein